ncbi:MAG: DEAD/DEAH box helicase, partial [Polyangiales bacterium]
MIGERKEGDARVIPFASGPPAEPVGDGNEQTSSIPVPRLRLFTERVVVDRGDLFSSDFEELDAPVLELSFDYPETTVRASDPRERFFSSQGSCMVAHDRDFEAEARARRALESLGAVDLECLDHYGLPPNSSADYLVRVDEDVHSRCAFTAHAVPQLRRMGWVVEIADDYPYQVVEGDVSWYADVEPEDERPDWFSLELGVEVDGQRINLLPVMLELLEDADGRSSFRSLARRNRKMCVVPVAENRYLPVPPERVQALLQVVIELYQGGHAGTERIAFPRMHASALVDLELAFDDGDADGPALAWHGTDEAREHGRRIARTPSEPSVREPIDLQATLRPYQRVGLAWLQHLQRCDVGGVLADDMGLGKTLQTISHIALERESGRATHPCLVVAPTSLVGNWKRELDKFAPHLEVVVFHGPKRHAHRDDIGAADVVVTSYPLVVRDEDLFRRQSFHLVVLDEAHTIKNVRSQAHKAVKRVPADHRLCLTGTPVENHLGELWALMDFLNPGLLGDHATFKSGYRVPIERDGDEDRLAALRHQVAPYILRRHKSEVAKELPPKTELAQPVELDGKQRELYESIRVAAHADVRKAIRKLGLAQSTIPILDALMKLRQVCCDPRLLRMEAARFVKRSAKLERLMELLPQQLEQGHRVLVFSQFTSMLALIAHELVDHGIRYRQLTGSTRDRQREVDAFENGDADVFLISLKAGGTGLNLVSA